MAILDQTYNVEDLPESQSDFTLLPPGEYSARITSCDLAHTKAGTGQYLKLRFDITGPEYAGRVVFMNLNIRNQNEKAEEIGRRQFGELLRACGLAQCKDTDTLIGHDVTIKVTIKKDADWGDKNEVKAIKALAGSKPPMPANKAKQAPKEDDETPPWGRR